MQPKQQSGSVPPGFSRPLTVGEVPLMACSNHNRHPDAPTNRTYRMLLSGQDKQARGYHALRLLRLRRIHMKQRWQQLALIGLTAVVGLSLIFWNQVTFPLLIYIQNLRLPVEYTTTKQDLYRCSAGTLPSLYINDDFSSWRGFERSESLQEAWKEPSTSMTRKMDYQMYEVNMALMEIVSKTLAAHHVDYAIVGSTLVGSYRFHDAAFWSDSLDVAMSEDDSVRVQRVLQQVNLVDEVEKGLAYKPADLQRWLVGSQAKLQLETEHVGKQGRIVLTPASGAALADQLSSFRINVSWWRVEERHPEDKSKDFDSSPEVVVLNMPVTDGSAETVRVPSTEWFPLTNRPLGMLVVAAPFNPLFYVNTQYNEAEPRCGSASSSKSSGFLYWDRFAGSCSILRSSYFYVVRDKVKDNCYREVLLYGGQFKSVAYVGGTFRPAEKFSSWHFV
ncbi:hypothetical protein BESB_027590 [Besnoitia besnoiti]|uniref:Transmembrane protein n=1 Tax=Besnoitia besnoiti TaxID=94643 RepID=A0A2A9M255_BESBE|nr:uncharacterized protein BESB_027590 [Besnoitia besnoiti]PFH31324.1 hypothetical protein BESB_027590 [Besnoitia besnoiti]